MLTIAQSPRRRSCIGKSNLPVPRHWQAKLQTVSLVDLAYLNRRALEFRSFANHWYYMSWQEQDGRGSRFYLTRTLRQGSTTADMIGPEILGWHRVTNIDAVYHCHVRMLLFDRLVFSANLAASSGTSRQKTIRIPQSAEVTNAQLSTLSVSYVWI